MAKKKQKHEPQHRGRIQAQGGGLEESEAWSQNKPLSMREGLNLLEVLKNKLPKKEFLLRESAFEKAKNFIEQAPDIGVDAQVSRTFEVKGTRNIRVDIEVIKGTAFFKINLTHDEE